MSDVVIYNVKAGPGLVLLAQELFSGCCCLSDASKHHSMFERLSHVGFPGFRPFAFVARHGSSTGGAHGVAVGRKSSMTSVVVPMST